MTSSKINADRDEIQQAADKMTPARREAFLAWAIRAEASDQYSVWACPFRLGLLNLTSRNEYRDNLHVYVAPGGHLRVWCGSGSEDDAARGQDAKRVLAIVLAH